jgi:hypothetical protein
VLGLSVSGCSQPTPEEILKEKITSSDDFRTCQDAHKAKLTHVLEGLTPGSLAQELYSLAERENITDELRTQLYTDADIYRDTDDGMNFSQDAQYFSSYCVQMFGGWEAD